MRCDMVCGARFSLVLALVLSSSAGCGSAVEQPPPAPPPPARARGIVSFATSPDSAFACPVAGKVVQLGDGPAAVGGWLEPRPAPVAVTVSCVIDTKKELASVVVEDVSRNLRIGVDIDPSSFNLEWTEDWAYINNLRVRWNEVGVTHEYWLSRTNKGASGSVRIDATGHLRLTFSCQELDGAGPLPICAVDPEKTGVAWLEVEHCTVR
ncbi:MAG: hypothetical protein IPJ34_40240 [Myxococcales bacterium]|nr:hypothetical protein [Myxococcales bacterium]